MEKSVLCAARRRSHELGKPSVPGREGPATEHAGARTHPAPAQDRCTRLSFLVQG